MMLKSLPPRLPHAFIESHTESLLNSYKKWTGNDLIPVESNPQTAAQKLFQASEGCLLALFWADFVVVSSNNAEEPLLTYGNQKCLDLWELAWKKLVSTPGRETAEVMHRDERQKFLDTVRRNGFIDHYSGIRISSSGKRFRIEKAIVWNLVDSAGQFLGQAAAFRDWKYL